MDCSHKVPGTVNIAYTLLFERIKICILTFGGGTAATASNDNDLSSDSICLVGVASSEDLIRAKTDRAASSGEVIQVGINALLAMGRLQDWFVVKLQESSLSQMQVVLYHTTCAQSGSKD